MRSKDDVHATLSTLQRDDTLDRFKIFPGTTEPFTRGEGSNREGRRLASTWRGAQRIWAELVRSHTQPPSQCHCWPHSLVGPDHCSPPAVLRFRRAFKMNPVPNAAAAMYAAAPRALIASDRVPKASSCPTHAKAVPVRVLPKK